MVRERAVPSWTGWCLAGVLALGLAACDTGTELSSAGRPTDPPDPEPGTCTIDERLLADGGVGKDGIPALTDPPLVGADQATYLARDSRVIGIIVGGRPVAVPHNILWWHEIVNFNVDEVRLAVTYCPLTGSSLVFDRESIGGGEFGVSGLLFMNNLTMYDRTSRESLWPQMNRQAGCGPRSGSELAMYPAIEMNWASWRELYPDTRVVSDDTGFSRVYTPNGYPYGDYEEPENGRLLFSMPIDGRRPPKERVLGIPDDDGGVAFPFGALDNGERYRVVHTDIDGEALVILWDAVARAAMAYHSMVEDQLVEFEVRDEQLTDKETGSVWRIDGRAVSGAMQGRALEPVAEAYVAFWFAWAAFHPGTELWED